MTGRRRMIICLAVVVGLLSAASVSNASTPPTGSVTGMVLLDGQPLAGVEVFLGILPGPYNPEFEARYTCTDDTGAFEFPDVPLEHQLISAVGPEVYPAIPCDNPKFFDPTTTPQRPLVAQFFNHHNSRIFDSFAAPAVIRYDVVRLPNDHPGTNNLARQALNFCYDHVDTDKALSFLAKHLEMVDKLVAKGHLDPAAAQLMRDYGDVLTVNFAGGCEQLVPSGA